MLGKQAKPISIHGLRSLTREDVALLREPRHRGPVVARFRDSHHRIARMVAAGLRNTEIHQRSGYSYGRIATLQMDPSFQELVSSYRDKVNQAFIEGVDEYYETLASNMLKVERMVADKLDDAINNDESLPIRDLIAIGRDAADRVGYGKKETRTNINIDMGKDIEAAIRRSAQARGLTITDRSNTHVTAPQQLDLRAEPTVQPQRSAAQPAPLRRRA